MDLLRYVQLQNLQCKSKKAGHMTVSGVGLAKVLRGMTIVPLRVQLSEDADASHSLSIPVPRPKAPVAPVGFRVFCRPRHFVNNVQTSALAYRASQW